MSVTEATYRKFTVKSETDKAINTLWGMLIGMSFDGVVADDELAELQSWVKEYEHLANRNPFREFIGTIQVAVDSQEERMEMLKNLSWLCERYEKDTAYYDMATAHIQTLQGICHGIIADGVIADEEIVRLDQWLEDHSALASYYPYDEIRSLLDTVLADGVIDDEERILLMAYFKEFVNLSDEKINSKVEQLTDNLEVSGLCTSMPLVSFENKNFCFTGTATRGTRAELAAKIKSLGGVFQKGVNKKTDFLIVGDNGNPAWAFACYGRKVEKAINLRKEGSHVQIVHEFDFWDFVEDAG